MNTGLRDFDAAAVLLVDLIDGEPREMQARMVARALRIAAETAVCTKELDLGECCLVLGHQGECSPIPMLPIGTAK